MDGQRCLRILLTASLLLTLAISAHAARIYVKWDSPGPTFDGTTWDTAYHTVEQAVTSAVGADEIWVAGGDYVVGSLTLKSGLALYGGFDGTETSREERAPTVNVTTLDGNQQGAVIIIPPGATNATTVDGFWITNGTGDPIPRSSGGGICCAHASATISNNVIYGNSASYGGGIYCEDSASVIITDNLIRGNWAWEGAGVRLANSSGSIMYNYITHNDAGAGGGVYADESDVTIAGNLIADNFADGVGGGGVYLDEGAPLLINNTIYHNESSWEGGGIYCAAELAGPKIENNIVTMCSSGIYVTGTGALSAPDYNDVCDNTAYQYKGISAPEHDISSDPLFVAPGSDDFRLQSGSPCRDVGDNTDVDPDWTDLDGNQRIYPTGGTVDMGALEYIYVLTPTMSPSGGTYTSAQSVTISTTTSGAHIHYTTDGTDPDSGSPLYSAPVAVTVNTTLKAKAYKTDWADSAIGTAAYVITGTVATPIFSPVAGTYTSAQSVTIATTTSGAHIHYTTDGTDPTGSSPLYSAPVAVAINTTLKAKAYKTDWADSAIGTAVYCIGDYPVNVSLSPTNGMLAIETKLTFTAVYSESHGYSHLRGCYLLVNATSSCLKAAYVRYDPVTNKLYVRNDGNTSWMGGYAPGVDKTIANGYGRIYCKDTKVVKAGNTITITWKVALKSPYTLRPTCKGYMYCVNDAGNHAGWDEKRTYSVR